MRLLLALAVVAAASNAARAQYTEAAGKNAPMATVPTAVHAADGTVHMELRQEKPKADRYGNAQGNNYDLAVDGAFEGQTVAVIQLYTEEGFDFSLPRAALKEKGFGVYRWSNRVPSPADLEKALAKSSQLWIISGSTQQLTDAHLAVIKKFFDAGHGVYIWGDNDPYYADANFVAKGLLGSSMDGDVPGAQVVGVEKRLGEPGVLANHLLSTGLENIYEGITIATIHPSADLHPLIYGSADNLVAAYYDKDGKRAILDGGFTRLYISWDSAGTPRYVKNAAAWLVNSERFGDSVIAKKAEKPHALAPIAPIAPVAPVVPVVPTTAGDPGLGTTKLGLILIGVLLALSLAVVVPAMMRRG